MRKILLTTVIAVAAATPAAARDGQPYVGVEGGILFARNQNANLIVDYTTTQTPAAPLATAGPSDTTFNNGLRIDYKRGIDVDAIAGYDLGLFRIEGELGYKRAKLDDFSVDQAFVTALNTALNRPSAVPDPGAPGLRALVPNDFTLDGRAHVASAMVNGLLDFGNNDGLSFFAGGGAGRARVRFAGQKDYAWAYQGIAGARFAVSSNIDFGLKYRYFQTAKLDLLDDSGVALNGNANRTVIGPSTPVIVDQTTNANVLSSFNQKFRSHSVLASLIFNFGSSVAPPPPLPPAPPPPPPAPPPPATQTCPDGSVILATDICPAPPPPPPPPPPAPERG